MDYALLADVVFLIHLGFVVFGIFGALLLFKWPRLVWLHLPVMAWSVVMEFTGWVCPLTPLENWLRIQAGEIPYSSGFVEHYLVPLLYPDNLTRDIQISLGIALLAANVLVYGIAWRQRRRRSVDS